MVSFHLIPSPTALPSRAAPRLVQLVRLRSKRVLALVLALPVAGPALSSLTAQAPSSAGADAQTHTVHGQVVNALDGSPLPRVLVTLNMRTVLTDSQGRFEFAGFTGATGFASVRKPGFTGDRNPRNLTDLDASLLFKLSPEALVLGTLTGQDGAPLSHILVRLLRLEYDGVVLRWLPAGYGTTDARGEYRISAAAGRFRLVSSFNPRSFETGETVLPSSFPGASQSGPSALIELGSGEEKRVDLRVRVGPVYPVAVHIDPADAQHRNTQIAVTTLAGDEFLIGISGDQHLELPLGSYLLSMHEENREDSLSGVSRVNILSHDTPAVTMHLAPDTPFTVELLAGTLTPSQASSNLNPNSGLAQLPNAQQFNLSLHNELANISSSEQDIHLRQAADRTGSSFRVPPGRYRLTASGGGPWHIQSATLGATDLLLDDLVVGPGSAGGTIRLLVSNQTGTVHARLPLTAGTPASLYLIPRGPSLIPVYPISPGSDSTGAGMATAVVPAGAYTALLMNTRLQEDPRDPAFLASFASGPVDVEVQPDASTSFSLDLAKRKGPQQ